MRWLYHHAFLFLYIALTVSSQLIMRWRVGAASAVAAQRDHTGFVVAMLMSPWVWGAILCTFLAGIAWMLTLVRFDLTYAFPFTGVSFVVILLAGALVFGEHVGMARVVGTLLVVLGLIVVVRS